MPDGRRVARSVTVAWVESEDRLALVRLDQLALDPLVLEGPAIDLWQLADDLTVEELTARAAERYALDELAIAADVRAFLDEAEKLGILTIS